MVINKSDYMTRKDVYILICCFITGFCISFLLNQSELGVKVLSGLIGGGVGFVAGVCVIARD